MRIVAIIQARLTSARLPGKVLMEWGRHAFLWHTIARTRASIVDEVVLAIPNTVRNDPLAIWAAIHDVPLVRGPEHDVITRYVMAADEYNADVVMRITGDCPLVDPDIINLMIEAWYTRDMRSSQYLSNIDIRTLPRGLDVELIGRGALRWCDRRAVTPQDREHVTTYIRRHTPQTPMFQVGSGDHSHLRWCLDTLEDWRWFMALKEHFRPDQLEPPLPTSQMVFEAMATHDALLHLDTAST